MGDGADMLIDTFGNEDENGLDGFHPYYIDESGTCRPVNPAQPKTCRCCKETGLEWIKHNGKWRLGKQGKLHVCPINPLKQMEKNNMLKITTRDMDRAIFWMKFPEGEKKNDCIKIQQTLAYDFEVYLQLGDVASLWEWYSSRQEAQWLTVPDDPERRKLAVNEAVSLLIEGFTTCTGEKLEN